MSRRRKERDYYRAAENNGPLITTGREDRAAACEGTAPVRGVMDASGEWRPRPSRRRGYRRSVKAEGRHSSNSVYRALAN